MYKTPILTLSFNDYAAAYDSIHSDGKNGVQMTYEYGSRLYGIYDVDKGDYANRYQYEFTETHN